MNWRVENLPGGGSKQTIDFPKTENQKLGVKTLKLKASSDSGLPVPFFIVSGPVELKDNDTLAFLPAPPRGEFSMRVIIGAYQCGRTIEPKIQSTRPTFQGCYIEP